MSMILVNKEEFPTLANCKYGTDSKTGGLEMDGREVASIGGRTEKAGGVRLIVDIFWEGCNVINTTEST